VRYRAAADVIPPDLRAQLRERRAEVLAELRHRAAAQRRSQPVSWNQLGLWLIHDATPDSAEYHIAVAARIVSAVNRAALRAAFQALSDRHEILRTVYRWAEDEPTQVVLGYQPVDFEDRDVGAIDDAALDELVRATYERPFDLTTGPVMRARLFSRGQNDAVLVVVWHHIAVDGWSTWVLLDELWTLYHAHATGATMPLQRQNAQYADFVRWQRDLVAGSDGDRLWTYWNHKLRDASPQRALGDRARRLSELAVGRSLQWEISTDRLDRMKALAAAERTSLFVVLLAVLKAVLFRQTGATDVIVGTPTFGRSQAEFQSLVGDLVNTVPLRTDLTGLGTFRELVSRVRETTLGALAHADYPFALLVRRLGIRREPGRSPVFDVFFNFQTPPRSTELIDLFLPSHAAGVRVTAGGLVMEPFPVVQRQGQFDLALETIERGDGLCAIFKYRRDLFDRATIERYARDFTTLVDTVVANPDVSVPEFALASAQDRLRLDRWNDTSRLVNGPLTLHGGFQAQVASCPDATAVADARTTLTYAQLGDRASRVASALRRHGVQPGAHVGIAVDRSVDMVAALLGILEVGAAYVPLDPSYPRDRLAHMVADSDVTEVITERRVTGNLPREATRGLLYLEDCLAQDRDAGAPAVVGAADVAYVMYTSGSTGGPKGVVIQHGAVAAMLDAFRERFDLSASDRWVATTTLSFDISVLEIFGPLSCGGSLFMATREDARDGARLARVLDERQPNLFQATPSTWQMLLETGWTGGQALTVLVGGEALSPGLASRLLARCGRLFNVYGPTETTVWATAAEIRASDQVVTIGRPLANVKAYVLNPERRLVPVGVVGELWIGGAGVALGYHGRDALTTERFVPDPFVATPGARMYRTGDLVRWRDGGELECLGRVDHQVKVRGHRIELDEIEHALERHPLVRQAVVAVRTGKDGGQHLAAYILPSGAFDTGDLRRFLRDSLPGYMIPAFYRAVDRFPQTPNGKVDRQRLLAVEVDTARPIMVPTTDLERRLVSVWEEMLDVRPVGVSDNFFDLGGHSLLAMRLCVRLADETGRKLHVATLFQAPTITELAQRLQEEDQACDDRLVVPIQANGPGPAFFCVPGAGDNPFIFADIARHLGADRPVYSFRFPPGALVDPSSPCDRVAAIARRLVDEIRAVQPSGPYLLGGYCFGGLVAFEMALQLHRAGESIASLTLFEMYLPGGLRMARAWDRVAHQFAYLRTLPWPERVSFLGRMASRRLTRAGRAWMPQLGDAIAPLTPRDDYTPRAAFAGALTLFRAQQVDGFVVDPEMGWRGLARTIVAHEIEGHHTDAYKEPQVSKWVAVLRHALAQAGAARRVTDADVVRQA